MKGPRVTARALRFCARRPACRAGASAKRVAAANFRGPRVARASHCPSVMNVLADPHNGNETRGYHGAVSDFKRRLIETTLLAAGGNRTHAARTLGLQRTYLLRLIRELRVAAPPSPGCNRRPHPATVSPNAASGAAPLPTQSEPRAPRVSATPVPPVPVLAPPSRPPARAVSRRDSLSPPVRRAPRAGAARA